MEAYRVRLTITGDSEIETRLLEHLAAKRRASMANECRDLLQAGLGRPVPATPLSETASRAKHAFKFDLSPANDVHVLASLAKQPPRDRPRWLRETLLAGFVHAVEAVESEAPSKSKAPSATHAPQPKEISSSKEITPSKDPSHSMDSTTKEPPASVDIELPIDSEGIPDTEGSKLRSELRGLLG